MPRLSQHSIARLRELLASPRFVWVVILVALVLGLPTLGVGLVGDDLAQQEFLRAQHEGRSDAPWWNMFALVEGPASRNLGLRTSGRYPWWTDPELHIVFFRPLSVLTHHLDHWLWPRTLWLMHLQSVLWHVLACALAWALARRLLASPATASVAALIYALSFGHTIPVAWLAHRNGLVSSAFALAALLAHDHWRRDGRKLGALLAPSATLASLLAAEAGVVVLAFFGSYTLCLDRAPWGRRLLALVPSVAITAVWLLAYEHAGFGATASGAYLDPFSDPAAFSSAFPLRYIWLLGSSVSPPLASAVPPWLWIVGTSLVGLSVVTYLVTEAGEVSRFGALAVAVGCVPLVTSHPGDRLLVLTSFGAALVFAGLLEGWLASPLEPSPLGWLRRLAAGLVVLVHLLVPPVASFYRVALFDELDSEGAAPAIGEGLPNEGLGRKGLVILHAPNFVSAEYLPVMRRARGLEAPNFTWLLHEGLEPPEIARVDERTLELHDARGWPAEGLSEYWRSTTRAPFAVGETIKTVDYVAEIQEIDGRGRATRVQFRFRARLDHPTFAWAWWEGDDYAPVAPETLGE